MAVHPAHVGLAHEPVLQARTGLALGMLGDGDVVEQLLKRLAATQEADTKAAIARALGFIGDVRSIDALVALIDDRDDKMAPYRDAAIAALGFMADRSAMPWRSELAHGTNYLAETPTLVSSEGSGVLNLK